MCDKEMITIDDAAHYFRQAMEEVTSFDDNEDAQNYMLDIVSRFKEIINRIP